MKKTVSLETWKICSEGENEIQQINHLAECFLTKSGQLKFFPSE